MRDQLAHCRQIMTIELNSVTDNPLFLVEEDRLIVMPGATVTVRQRRWRWMRWPLPLPS